MPLEEELPFYYGYSGFIVRNELVEASSKIKNKIFFMYRSEFKKSFNEFKNGRKALDILTRTNWLLSKRVGANAEAMKRLVKELSFNPVALVVGNDIITVQTTDELVNRIPEHVERVKLSSPSFRSSLTDILSMVRHHLPVLPKLVPIISEFTTSELGYAPTTVIGNRAEFGTRVVASISDFSDIYSDFKPVGNVHDFITLNANCLMEVQSLANTSLGEFYSQFLN